MSGDTTHLGGWIHGGDPDTTYPELWAFLKRQYGIERVLDVGSGAGFTAKFWRDALKCEVTALEADPAAIQNAVVPTTHHDFTHGPYFGKLVDLAWCCEVLEHIEAEYVPHILATFSRAKVIALTHGVPGQPGVHHVNCQPSTYWAKRLMSIGYHLDYSATRKARALGHAYFCKTGVIYTRRPMRIPTMLGIHLLNLEWFPRRVWRHLTKRGGLASALRLLRV